MPEKQIRRLGSELVPVDQLSEEQVRGMFRVFETYFENTTHQQFDEDLARKTWCVVLRDQATGQIQGFSTIQHLQFECRGARYAAVFSGDTIVARPYWGSTELVRAWAQHVFGAARTISADAVFWFLITAGYRTYRFLPVFFQEFYPAYTSPTEDYQKRILDAVAAQMFSDEYDPRRGIVRLIRPTPLRGGVSDVDAARLADPHVRFFVEKNPGYAVGDELACLTRLSYDNLTKAGRRLFPSELAPTLASPTSSTSIPLSDAV